MSRILVTGATGFVGRAVCPILIAAGHHVRAAVRHADADVPCTDDILVVQDIGPDTNWQDALADIDSVVHLAARVHQKGEMGEAAALAHHRINADGTRRLAQAAAQAGVRRLLFISSIKVNGEATPSQPFRETDLPAPYDAYAASKWEAEKSVVHAAAGTALETVILRPPLVYGPGAGGNLRSLLRLCASGLPLPLGRATNLRSLIGLGNLASAILAALFHSKAAGKTYLVCDGEDLSVTDLIRRLRVAMGQPERLISIPTAWLRNGLTLIGHKEMAVRLLDTLTLDDAQIRRDLGWTPPQSVDAGLASMAASYLTPCHDTKEREKSFLTH